MNSKLPKLAQTSLHKGAEFVVPFSSRSHSLVLSILKSSTFLSENEVIIQKKLVKLGNKIKTTGEYSVDIDLHPEVNCSLDIEILSPKTSA